MSDGCTGWFDGFPEWVGGSGDEWVRCCHDHDRFYADAHHFGEYLVAHWELAQCVATVSGGVAATMFVGVVAGTVAFGKKVLPGWWLNRR